MSLESIKQHFSCPGYHELFRQTTEGESQLVLVSVQS